LLVVAALLQAGTAWLAPGSVATRVVTLALSGLLVALFLWGNWQLAGMPLIALGLLLNAVVVGLNFAMPVSLEAAARAGLAPEELHLGDDPLHEAAGPGTRLGLLGDQIPVALPWRPQVVSPGDVLIAAGVGLLLVTGAPVRPGPAPSRRPVGDRGQSRTLRPTVLESDSTTRGSYS
jgi:hypothetical protein